MVFISVLEPGVPTRVSSTSSLTTIFVSWSEPSEPNGKITKYELCWSEKCERVVPVSSNVNFTIRDLNPGTSYTIHISAFTQIGQGLSVSHTNTTVQSGML